MKLLSLARLTPQLPELNRLPTKSSLTKMKANQRYQKSQKMMHRNQFRL
jgi:hypothetical protein